MWNADLATTGTSSIETPTLISLDRSVPVPLSTDSSSNRLETWFLLPRVFQGLMESRGIHERSSTVAALGKRL
jgi:hypothetical protein